jgi:hypothetical protein
MRFPAAKGGTVLQVAVGVAGSDQSACDENIEWEL